MKMTTAAINRTCYTCSGKIEKGSYIFYWPITSGRRNRKGNVSKGGWICQACAEERVGGQPAPDNQEAWLL